MIAAFLLGVMTAFAASFGLYILCVWRTGRLDPFEREIDLSKETVHELKCHPEPFLAVRAGDKTHEVRVFDRPYRAGDLLLLKEFLPDDQTYTGAEVLVRVTHVTEPGTWGLPENVGVLSIREEF